MGIRYRFIVGDNKYVYDAVSGRILEVEDDIYRALLGWKNEETPYKNEGTLSYLNPSQAESYSNLRRACEEGLLSTESPSLINPIALPSFEKALTNNFSGLTLCVTEKCNLRCSYCPYTYSIGTRHQHSHAEMSWDTAKKAVQLFKGGLDPKEKMPVVAFYGGEPLLAFDLMRRVVEYVRNIFVSRPVFFNMTTNGTVINRRIAQFLISNGFNLLMSLDGPLRIHDRYRTDIRGNGSYKRVIRALSLLRDLSSDYCKTNVSINMVMAPPFEIEVVNEYLQNNPLIDPNRSSVSLPDGSDTAFYEKHPLTETDIESLNKLRQRAEQCFIKGEWRSDPMARSIFKKPMLKMAFKSKLSISGRPYIPTGQCFPGGHKLFVGSNGLLHMCERIDEGFPIGNIDEGIDIQLVKKYLYPYYNDALITCRDCYALRDCSLCLNDTMKRGKFDKRKKRKSCVVIRKYFLKNLKSYVKIIKSNPSAFKTYQPLIPAKGFTRVLSADLKRRKN